MLGKIGTDSAAVREALGVAAKDEDPNVRKAASDALATLN